MKVYENILDLEENFDIFIFDAYGVFWDGSDFYENSRENMKKLIDDGKDVYILSNSTQTVAEAEKNYTKKGLLKGIHYKNIVTSGEVTRSIFLSENEYKNKKIYSYGMSKPAIFDDLSFKFVDNPEEADYIYISTPVFTEEKYTELLKKGFSKDLFFEAEIRKDCDGKAWNCIEIEPFLEDIKFLASKNKPILVSNPDEIATEIDVNTNEKHFVIRQGAISNALKKIGAKVIEFGKPSINIFNFLFEKMLADGINILHKDRICMIGDTLHTDIKGANNAGIKAVLCVETGVTNYKASSDKPLLEAIEDLQKEANVTVDYYIKAVGSSKSTPFKLVEGLAKKRHITDLKLCTVLFENNKFYPWVFLVPKRNGVKNMTYLNIHDRLQLMKEMAIVEKVMVDLFPCDQTNVAMIGNKTPQLHVHILCRKEGDPDWPTTVWNNHSEPYDSEEEINSIIEKIKNAIESKKTQYL